MSPSPTTEPSRARAVRPDTKTNALGLSTLIACENTPTGLLSLRLLTSTILPTPVISLVFREGSRARHGAPTGGSRSRQPEQLRRIHPHHALQLVIWHPL